MRRSKRYTPDQQTTAWTSEYNFYCVLMGFDPIGIISLTIQDADGKVQWRIGAATLTETWTITDATDTTFNNLSNNTINAVLPIFWFPQRALIHPRGKVLSNPSGKLFSIMLCRTLDDALAIL